VTTAEHHWQLIDEGTLIAGRYRLSRWLGLGGSGEVWAARDERLGRDVAVKLIAGDRRPDPAGADRFTREAIAVARINHPNVVAVYDQGEHNQHRFLVMELVTGRNLAELRGARPMAVGAAMAISVQIGRALEAAHGVGVVHRDVKPANIMVTHDGVVKVLDFGIASFVRSAGHTMSFTATEENMGTPAYLAPERLSGGASDPSSDLYSLGCVLYELLTGRPPFIGVDDLTVLDQHLHAEPAPLRSFEPAVPVEIEQLVLWMLAKDPAARPPSVGVTVARLESLAHAYPTEVSVGAGVSALDAMMRLEEEVPQQTRRIAAWTRAVVSERSAGSAAGGGAGRHPGNAGRTAPRRSRRGPLVFIGLCVAAGLAFGALAGHHSGGSRAAASTGAMPSADAATSGARGSGAGALPSASAAGSTEPPGFDSGTTPKAPTSPYQRYTQVAAGTGCVSAQPGQFACMVGRVGGAPVYQAGGVAQVGTLAAGSESFYCQSSGGEYSHSGFSNHWWAWTQSGQGQWGWVSVVDIAGGDNNEPEPGLPSCGN
jgi:hypothetical protein